MRKLSVRLLPSLFRALRSDLLLVAIFAAWMLQGASAHSASDLNNTQNDEASSAAQSSLRDPNARMKVIGADPKAKSVDDYVQSVSKDPKDKQKMYDLSADILPIILKMADNDPAKAQALLEQAQKDPEKFLNSLPADEQAKIHKLATEIEKKSPASTKP